MNTVFTREGFRTLRVSWLVLAGAALTGAAIIGASQWFLARERRENVGSTRRMEEARVRVDTARRERASLEESSVAFKNLLARGLMQGEQRLELVELVNALRTRFGLFTLDYEIAPQRTLTLAGGRVFPSVDMLSSRVKIRLRALHEGDVVGFLEALEASPRGFYPAERCVLRRLEGTAVDALQAHVEAECSLEWITLREKGRNRAS